jgi:hypothetical protein
MMPGDKRKESGMPGSRLIRGYNKPRRRSSIPATRRWTIDPRNESLPVLRREIATFARWSGLVPDDIDAALLIVNELVSNVIDHAHTTGRVTMRLSSSTVRFFVSDDSPAEPVLRAPDVHAFRGRGMQIVAGLARRWGCHPHHTGKTVWASMDRTCSS